jgi:hypothetical protein
MWLSTAQPGRQGPQWFLRPQITQKNTGQRTESRKPESKVPLRQVIRVLGAWCSGFKRWLVETQNELLSTGLDTVNLYVQPVRSSTSLKLSLLSR